MVFCCSPVSLVFLSCFVTISFISSTAAFPRNGGGITVDLIHRDSPLSPFYNPSVPRFQRLRNSFARSFSRFSALKLALNSSDKMVAPIISNSGEYLMTIGIGTPPVQVLAIADTGSDLTWTQCAPCTACYNQTAPPFDPNKTSTYRSVPCTSQQCRALGTGDEPTCDDADNCLYQISYGDNSYSNGKLATETFTFNSGKNPEAFPDVVFGCGHNNQGTFDVKGSGIVGLGGGSLSIVRQLGKSVGGKFSYCLTSLTSNGSSKISFGNDAIPVGPNVSSTPLLKKSVDTFYYLTLEGISVGGNRVQYKYGPHQPGNQGDIIIDSGTTLTMLPSDLYSRLEAALVKVVVAKRVNDSQGAFRLCYAMSGDGGQIVPPPITIHFAGADVAVADESVFVEVEKEVSCLTFVPSDSMGMAIFGNLHQINHVVGYDLVNQKLSFLQADCDRV